VAKSPNYILCIETANTVTSVAISKDGVCIALKEIQEPNKAADALHLLVEATLKEAELTFSNLHAIAISTGPGSYTGLRIAAAAAKGYCFALNIPLIAISTLQAMVHGIIERYHQNDFDIYVPMIDARRMEVFTSFYDKKLNCTSYFTSLIIDEQCNNLFNPEKRYILFGNGAAKTKIYNLSANVYIDTNYIPSALDICNLAAIEFSKNNFQDIAYYEPQYYKAFHSTSH